MKLLLQKRNMIALGLFVCFYVVFGIVLTVLQERVIYVPGTREFATCPEFASAEKVVYEGTRMYVEDGARGVVVFYHGNAGTACDREFLATQFVRAGFGFVMVEYAGYGEDARRPSHTLVKRDVEHVIAFLAEREYAHTAVVAESIGTAAAAYHTSLSPPDRLVLLSPLASIHDVASRRFWFYPTGLLVDNAFDSTVLLKEYHGSVVIIHGDRDSVVPYTSGKKLYESLATDDKKFVTIPERGHNDLFHDALTFDALQDALGNIPDPQ